MKNDYEDEIKISPVGLINLSRAGTKIQRKYYYKNSNLYNCCYINSSMQCLFRLDEFVKNILKCDKGNLTMATKNLIYNMQNTDKKKKYCSVSEIKKVMGEKNEIYNNDQQEDVNEFITNYLDELVEETKDNGKNNWFCLEDDKEDFNKFYDKYTKRKGNSFILDLFYGILRREEYCKNCDLTCSLKFNVFNILELPIYEEKNGYKYEEPINIEDLLRKYISEKVNEEEVCLSCEKDLTVKTSIYSLPKCLIIYFNRDYCNNKKNKIIIQKTINFEKFVYDKSLNIDNDYYYHLKGIIFYSYFSSTISHYKSACLVNNTYWYYFDDSYYETDQGLLSLNEDDNPVALFYEK